MASQLIDALGTTDELAAIFGDESILRAMLDFEAALARAESRAGLIPAGAARAIEAGARADGIDAASIARESRTSATPAVALVHALTARVRQTDPEAARFVHYGATSQDVTDSAIVLLLRRARPALERDHQRLAAALKRLSDAHAGSVMLARTLLQAAPPTTFGLKAAGWWASEQRAWSDVSRAFDEATVLQFGGASGTLAALGDRALPVSEALARELDLPLPRAPWHAHRDRLAALLAALAVLTGSIGKLARDLALLMQTEVAEAAEPGGGSSTMPQKRNPAGSAIALAAANRVPGLVAAFLAGMVQEHERSVGGGQAEWPTVAAVVQAAGAALAAMAGAVDGLTVHPDRMRANIDATNGVVFAERLSMCLASRLDRDVVHRLLADVSRRVAASGRPFGEVVRESPELAQALTAEELRDLDDPQQYLGAAEIFRRRLLGEI